jgi:hypothetical protein
VAPKYHPQHGDHGWGRIGGHPSCSPKTAHDAASGGSPARGDNLLRTWEGTWDGVLSSRLVVEEIDATSARVVYAWADDPQGRFTGGWSRIRAKILPGGALQWGSDVKFVFKMAKDHRSIEGEREQAEHISLVTMQKIARE